MDFAYATLEYAGTPNSPGRWLAKPTGHEHGWLVINPRDIPVEQNGAVVLIKYEAQDQFCRVVTPMDVEQMAEMASNVQGYRQVCHSNGNARAAHVGW
jgi:hypothetical protein